MVFTPNLCEVVGNVPFMAYLGATRQILTKIDTNWNQFSKLRAGKKDGRDLS